MKTFDRVTGKEIKPAIFIAKITSPFGIFQVAIEAFESEAKREIRYTFEQETKCHPALISFLSEPKKVTKKTVSNMGKGYKCNFAWIERVNG